MPKLRLAAAQAVLALAGCAALPAAQQAQAPSAHLILQNVPTPAVTLAAWPTETWWKSYADPQLDGLIERALVNNPTLAAASARIAQAEAAAGSASAEAAARLNADANVSYGRQSENYLIPKPPLGKGGQSISQGWAGISLGYDLDLWGRHAALIRAARDQADAAGFDLAAARLALTTSLAHSYAQLASQYELLDLAEATLKQRQAIADLTRLRNTAGLDTQAEIRQAESGTAALRAELVQAQTAIAVTSLQLAVLAGAMPETAAAIKRPRMQMPPFNLPANLPLDLLGRRPEIAAQRARIDAATEQIQVARAQFYPNLNLSAMLGYQAIGIGQLLSSGSLTSSIGPAIHLPLFDGGLLRANYRLKLADLDAVIAQYNQSVLAAAQDAVEQLTRSAALEREATATTAALAAAQEAYRLAQLRYREGLSSYLTVLAVENQLLSQQRALTSLNARRLDLQIALVRALGGGFANEFANESANIHAAPRTAAPEKP